MREPHAVETQVNGAAFYSGCADYPTKQQNLIVLSVQHLAQLLEGTDTISYPWSKLDLKQEP
jgi:hypothetical protein